MSRVVLEEKMPIEVELAASGDDPQAGYRWLHSFVPRRAENVAVWTLSDPSEPTPTFRIAYDIEPPTMPAKLRRRASRRAA